MNIIKTTQFAAISILMLFYFSTAFARESVEITGWRMIEASGGTASKYVQEDKDSSPIKIKRKIKQEIKYYKLSDVQSLNKGDEIITDSNSAAVITIGSRKKIILDVDTHIKIISIPDKIEGKKGTFFVDSIKEDGLVQRGKDVLKKILFSVETKYATTALLGTRVSFKVDENMNIPDVTVLKGKVKINSKNKSFEPIVLNTYGSYVNRLLTAAERDSMEYRGLGEGAIIYTPTGSGIHRRDGTIIHSFAHDYEPPEVVKIYNWLEKLGYTGKKE